MVYCMLPLRCASSLAQMWYRMLQLWCRCARCYDMHWRYADCDVGSLWIIVVHASKCDLWPPALRACSESTSRHVRIVRCLWKLLLTAWESELRIISWWRCCTVLCNFSLDIFRNVATWQTTWSQLCFLSQSITIKLLQNSFSTKCSCFCLRNHVLIVWLSRRRLVNNSVHLA